MAAGTKRSNSKVTTGRLRLTRAPIASARKTRGSSPLTPLPLRTPTPPPPPTTPVMIPTISADYERAAPRVFRDHLNCMTSVIGSDFPGSDSLQVADMNQVGVAKP